MPLRIEEYAMIGDCETAALVGRDGSIDWLCAPRFDSPACFAALLGDEGNGRWIIRPTDVNATSTRVYRGHTMILETQFTTATGVATVVDFMVPDRAGVEVIRIVYGMSGTVEMTTELVMRFDYGATEPWVHRLDDGALRAIAGPEQLVLRTPVELKGVDKKTVGTFVVSTGSATPFVLAHHPSHLPPPSADDPFALLAQTEQFWAAWAARIVCHSPEEHATTMRSLLTLKALTYAPTGGIVAAPTTSLPETLGGVRNWDYRFCWLRDATLSLLALMNAGYFDEATAWRDWLIRAVAGSPAQAQIMYGCSGERALYEHELPHLEGYEMSLPVRIGNAAHDQLQLDVYGEVMDALYQAFRGGVPNSAQAWSVQRAFLEHLEKIWRNPDRGIWESRGEPRHYTFSKVMAWVAFDRGIKLAREAQLEGPVDKWVAIAAEIHAWVCANGFDATLGTFVQAAGSTWLDGSLLLIPSTGFLPANDPRILGTIAAIEKNLMNEGFVMRHDSRERETGLNHSEGAFLACSFWLADALALVGRGDDARALFTRLLALRNDVGLLAEQYDPRFRRLVGNFPQAFSHVSLITTAHKLMRAQPQQRDQPPG
ncbi:MAG TPA: glycoside hydrolase family 15 protein [Kofleriaceae bacterium]|jgi:GH15 family glucan-1,4-alpha-glucosidase